MKTIGLLGGMSWESTLIYYQMINREVAKQLGGLHSARILLFSFDFAEVERLQRENRWEQAADLLAKAALGLQAGGADFVALCTNTMHRVAGEIESRLQIPLLHIVDPTASAIQAAGLGKVGLLGTKFTMEERFYKQRMEDKFHLVPLVPEPRDRNLVQKIIYDELCRGVITNESRSTLQHIVRNLVERGAEGVILGCT